MRWLLADTMAMYRNNDGLCGTMGALCQLLYDKCDILCSGLYFVLCTSPRDATPESDAVRRFLGVPTLLPAVT